MIELGGIREFSPVALDHLLTTGQLRQTGKSSGIQLLPNAASPHEEIELFHHENVVVWSVGDKVRRTFTFQPDQIVRHVLFARFPSDLDFSDAAEALAVVFARSVHVFFESGKKVLVPLGIDPVKVWAFAPGGLLLLGGDNVLSVMSAPLAPLFQVPGINGSVEQVVQMPGSSTFIALVLSGKSQSLLFVSIQVASSAVVSQAIHIENMRQFKELDSCCWYQDFDGLNVLAVCHDSILTAFRFDSDGGGGVQLWYQEQALQAVALEATRKGRHDLIVMHDEHSLSLRIHNVQLAQFNLLPLLDETRLVDRVTRATRRKIRLSKLDHAVNGRLNIVLSNGCEYRCDVDYLPKSRLVCEVLEQTFDFSVCNVLLSRYLDIRFGTLRSAETESEWNCLTLALLSCFGDFQVERAQHKELDDFSRLMLEGTTKEMALIFNLKDLDLVPVSNLRELHDIWEASRNLRSTSFTLGIDETEAVIGKCHSIFNRLRPDLSRHKEWRLIADFSFFICKIVGQFERCFYYAESFPYLLAELSSHSSTLFRAMESSFQDPDNELLRIIESNENGLAILKELLSYIISKQLSLKELDKFPMSLRLPLAETVSHFCNKPDYSWPADIFKLLGRNDIFELITGNRLTLPFEGQRDEDIARKPPKPDDLKDSDDDESELETKPANLKSISDDHVSKSLFPNDLRLAEVDRLFRTDRPVTMHLSDSQKLDLDAQQGFLTNAANRTASLFFGKALVAFSSIEPNLAYPFTLEEVNLSGSINDMPMPIKLDMTTFPPESQQWIEFHSGTAHGIQISCSAAIDCSWIAFNKPESASFQHAGFLYGLGLNGHLTKLDTFHIYDHLNGKHEMTTMALLIGLSVANCGKSSTHVTKLLSLHIPSLLPRNSIDLNLGSGLQTAALMGLGLLYMGTATRRISELLLEEINRKELFVSDINSVYRDAYSLSAGFALGFVNLGCGSNAHVHVDSLASLIRGGGQQSNTTGDAKQAGGDGSFTQSCFKEGAFINTNVTAPGSIVALALMYLKSEDLVAAAVMEFPKTRSELGSLQPDRITLLTLGKSLILWSQIETSQSWVESRIPAYLQEANNDSKKTWISYSIITGACFAMALKFASSGDGSAYATIMHYYDLVFKASTKILGTSLSDKMRKSTAKACLNSLTLSLGILMAGTGDLALLRKLRRLHSKIGPESNYGNHLAVHMALGFLFIGRGKYSLGTSNKCVAALLCACYPRFTATIGDNRSFLQVFRHLWVLAVESRFLVTRDVDSREFVRVQVQVTMSGGSLLQLETPCKLPELENIQKVTVRSEKYWPLELQVSENAAHRQFLAQDKQFLPIKRRNSLLGFDFDLGRWCDSLLMESAILGSTGDYSSVTILQGFYDKLWKNCSPAETIVDKKHFDKVSHKLRYMVGLKACKEEWPITFPFTQQLRNPVAMVFNYRLFGRQLERELTNAELFWTMAFITLHMVDFTKFHGFPRFIGNAADPQAQGSYLDLLERSCHDTSIEVLLIIANVILTQQKQHH